MTDNIKPFTGKTRRRQLGAEDVEVIGFLSKADDGEYWIEDRAAIAKIFALLKREGIKIISGDMEPP